MPDMKRGVVAGERKRKRKAVFLITLVFGLVLYFSVSLYISSPGHSSTEPRLPSSSIVIPSSLLSPPQRSNLFTLPAWLARLWRLLIFSTLDPVASSVALQRHYFHSLSPSSLTHSTESDSTFSFHIDDPYTGMFCPSISRVSFFFMRLTGTLDIYKHMSTKASPNILEVSAHSSRQTHCRILSPLA